MKSRRLAVSAAGAAVAAALAFLTSWSFQSIRPIETEATEAAIAERRTFDPERDISVAREEPSGAGERSREEIIAQTERLCRRLPGTDSSQLRFHAERAHGIQPRRGERAVWLVTVVASDDTRLAHTRWDAFTGGLEEFSWTPQRDSQEEEPIASVTVAARLGSFWLRRLAPRHEPWRISGAVERHGDAWNAAARSGTQRATVKLAARSGQLLWVRFDPGVTP